MVPPELLPQDTAVEATARTLTAPAQSITRLARIVTISLILRGCPSTAE
jgi:hypothetical protein